MLEVLSPQRASTFSTTLLYNLNANNSENFGLSKRKFVAVNFHVLQRRNSAKPALTSHPSERALCERKLLQSRLSREFR